jgi:hypothetical protein
MKGGSTRGLAASVRATDRNNTSHAARLWHPPAAAEPGVRAVSLLAITKLSNETTVPSARPVIELRTRASLCCSTNVPLHAVAALRPSVSKLTLL